MTTLDAGSSEVLRRRRPGRGWTSARLKRLWRLRTSTSKLDPSFTGFKQANSASSNKPSVSAGSKFKLGLRQFLLLIWKGATLRKRHWIVTLFEILLPLAVVALYVWLRTILNPENNSSQHPASYFTPSPLTFPLREKCIILYTPDNTLTQKITFGAMENIRKKEQPGRRDIDIEVYGCSNEEVLYGRAVDYESNNSRYDTCMFGLVYENIKDSQELPSSLDYKIRSPYNFETESTFPGFSLGGPGHAESSYVYSGFLDLQHAIDREFINMHQKENIPLQNIKDIIVLMLRFPYPEFYDRSVLEMYFSVMSLAITYAFSTMMMTFVKRLVDEKINRAKEMMRMMGLNDFVYWAGNFFNTFLLMLTILTVTTILFVIPFDKGQAVVQHSDSFLLWVIFLLYSATSVIFCLALSTLFHRPVVSTIATLIVWSVSYSVPRFLLDPPATDKYDRLHLGPKLATSLLPNMGFHWALRIVSVYEGIGEGAKWSNLCKATPGDNISLAAVMAMMLLSCFLYAFLIFYIDNVWPWQYGIPKHPLFLFMPSYWRPRLSDITGAEDLEDTRMDKSYFEDDPVDKAPGIIISHLTKVFGWGSSRKTAVNDVTLTMYRGEITALLGHNGAGKTTTMNVITGLFAPTKGTAVVEGYNILDNLKMARHSMGLCPQHNVLYDDMTVEEHLTFFAGLKGRSFSEMKPDITSCLELLQLQNKRNDLSKNLSGGMKRKLSLGIAMIGGSEVLILDEPTSGMDPQARRAIWDLLQEIRHERTIVLTTHYMEEADILGDRIAIMAQGTIQCCGSPLFLKRKFGAGYHLRVSKGELFNEDKMREVIQRSVPSAYVESDMRTECAYVLPVTEVEPFINMFEVLESEKQDIGYTACGLSITTMEDVFIKVGQLADRALDTDSTVHTPEVQTGAPAFQVKAEDHLQGVMLWFQQVHGLLLKRFHDARRFWAFLIFLIFLPLIVVFLMLYTRNALNSLGKDIITPLVLDLKTIFGPTFGFNGGYPKDNPIMMEYEKVLSQAGVSIQSSNNLSQSILDIGRNDLQKYKHSLLVSGNISTLPENTYAFAMYSGEAYHATALSLNLMDTALLRYATGDPSATIRTTNAPLPNLHVSANDIAMVVDLSNRLIISFFLPLALSFLSASFVLFPIHERQTKSKLLQMMTGINGLTFWLTHFIWDFAMHFVSSCFMLIPFVVMDQRGVYSGDTEAPGVLFLMLILYGWCSIPQSYLMSFISTKPSTGFTAVSGINFISGTIATAAITIYKLVAPPDKKLDAEKAAWGLRVLPNFAMTWGTANLDSIGTNNVFCSSISPGRLDYACSPDSPPSPLLSCCPDICEPSCHKIKDFFSTSDEGVSRDLAFMFWTGLAFFGLLAIIESNLIRFWYKLKDSKQVKRLIASATNVVPPIYLGEDSDVAAERTRVEQVFQLGMQTEEALVVHNLTRFFGNINAVDHVTFSVHHNECFGLLGVNGAGKTTTFSMLTGDLAIGEGTALIGNYSVRDHLNQFQQQIGYCPQFDALLDRMSAREALYLFARLRGVQEKDICRIVDRLIDVVDLKPHADKTAEKYSGGNRRKLSLAISLVGSPPVVFLDEPTAGVDPASRRKIWNAFTQVQLAGGTSFILTTHSMEECEALCGRLVIMVNGTFRCLGAIQYLKSKFGQGYTIIVKLNKEQHLDPQATEAVRQFFDVTFPGSLLKDVHQGMLHYHIVDSSFTWSHLFREMEGAKKAFNLEDYLISDTTLEQIFLAFAKTQRIVAAP